MDCHTETNVKFKTNTEQVNLIFQPWRLQLGLDEAFAFALRYSPMNDKLIFSLQYADLFYQKEKV